MLLQIMKKGGALQYNNTIAFFFIFNTKIIITEYYI